MPRLLKDGAFVADRWVRVLSSEPGQPLPGDALLLPLELWQQARATLLTRTPEQVGIWMTGDSEPEAIGTDVARFGCIAIEFPAFMDGRGFSCGRLLRERYGYRGELRAIGDIIPDQLHYLWRCGFDAFELPDSVSLEIAQGCLNAFSTAYRADARPAA